ncbi:MAG: hypothetical protein A2161_14520 [Candidatus Schekmanbacteria bacterium RBG_13_48_7]|uniref:Glycosyltransferase 2-like domain-containing protein n=1 Tax=Candidatus Schekmanbacteria bacterium RBG_13_48_7 TaxID=1817878 RepID=A0A1F7S0H4_9BACT|nr:MAG: hypothetical protein A2161_14520 [Candidatus Schekmanbacteria bacterium RBG_13_48_7]
MKISAVIITRNEEDNITDCIKSLRFADEIIVIDNGSVDDTVLKAKSLGAIVYQISGLDFSSLRNYAKGKAKGEWLLYLDADERIISAFAQEMRFAITHDRFSAYNLRRKNYFFGKEWIKEEKMIRLMKKSRLIGWKGILHETPIIEGLIGDLTNAIQHYTHRDLSSMVTKTNEWSEIEAQLRFTNNHPKVTWWRLFRVMGTGMFNSYILNQGWKSGTHGIIEGIYQGFSMFVTYSKLWERQNLSFRS